MPVIIFRSLAISFYTVAFMIKDKKLSKYASVKYFAVSKSQGLGKRVKFEGRGNYA